MRKHWTFEIEKNNLKDQMDIKTAKKMLNKQDKHQNYDIFYDTTKLVNFVNDFNWADHTFAQLLDTMIISLQLKTFIRFKEIEYMALGWFIPEQSLSPVTPYG